MCISDTKFFLFKYQIWFYFNNIEVIFFPSDVLDLFPTLLSELEFS